MPQRSAIVLLPEDVRAELDRRLVAKSFSGYQQLADWLAEQGCQISASSVQRYGQKFQQRLQALKVATDQARALAETAPDDEGAMSDALLRLVQEKIFSLLVELDVEQVDRVNLSSLTKAVAQIARASVRQKEWMQKMQDKAREAADRVEAKVRQGGLSAEAVQAIRRDILGIAS